MSDAEYAMLCYQLTTLPAGQALLATLAGALGGILLIPLFMVTGMHHLLQLMGSIYSTILDSFIAIIAGLATILLAYHTVRQLLLVSRIQAAHVGISLFDREPAHAFSALTARTAVGLVLLSYAGFLSQPTATMLGRNDLLITFTAVVNPLIATLLGVAVFVLPLLGMRKVLSEEKRQRLQTVHQRLERTMAEIDARMAGGELEGVEKLKTTLETLIVQRDLLNKVSPWPWRAETANTVLGAVLLPLLIWAIQRLLESVF
jgi:hypothetical protein